MFRRTNPVSGLRPENPTEMSQPSTSMNELPLRPATAPQPQGQQMNMAPNSMPMARPAGVAPAAATLPGNKAAADLPASRFGGIPGVMPRRVAQGQEQAAQDQQGLRKLIVGREISLSGDITACDILVVEGHIEATLRDGRHLEITEAGHFKGSVEIDEADIGGKFEGSLTVRGRLKLRSTGIIEGTISYGEIEVEAGGKLIGEIKALSAGAGKKSAKTETTDTRTPALADA